MQNLISCLFFWGTPWWGPLLSLSWWRLAVMGYWNASYNLIGRQFLFYLYYFFTVLQLPSKTLWLIGRLVLQTCWHLRFGARFAWDWLGELMFGARLTCFKGAPSCCGDWLGELMFGARFTCFKGAFWCGDWLAELMWFAWVASWQGTDSISKLVWHLCQASAKQLASISKWLFSGVRQLSYSVMVPAF